MSSSLVRSVRTKRESVYGAVSLVLGPLLWIFIALAILGGLSNPKTAAMVWVYVAYGVIFAVGAFIGGLVYRAHAFGNMVLIGPDQFPKLHAMVDSGAKRLGLSPTPRAFLYNSNGLFNAFARRILAGRYVFLTSALVDAESDEQVGFVIGHELGHHAAGHLNGWLTTARLPCHFIPFLMPAYSRAREYTCDQIGAQLTSNPGVSRSSLAMLGCGCGRLNSSLNCEALEAQERLVPPVFGFINEIFASHPRLTRRLHAIKTSGNTGQIVA